MNSFTIEKNENTCNYPKIAQDSPMQPLIPRQHDILEIARRDGRVNVERLAECFDVTPQTIRKDLNDLCGLNKLQRVHGGAVFPSDTVNLAYQSRRRIASARWPICTGARRSNLAASATRIFCRAWPRIAWVTRTSR